MPKNSSTEQRSDSDNFAGKVALVTGAARGQGRSHAIDLARHGADVILLDICQQIASVEAPMATAEDLALTVKLVEEVNGKALPIQCDVRDSDAVEKAVQEGVARFGRLDYVVANAGILATTGRQSLELDAWHASIDTMLSGVYFTLRSAIGPMLDAGNGGSIVVTSSTSGLRPSSYKLDMLNPGQIGYAAAKHGVLGITRNFAMALGSHNIRVNSVHPMAVRTPMIVNNAFASNISDAPAGWMANVMNLDAIEPQDVTDAVIWLLSDAARYVTGTSIAVDAGLMLL
jgi:SDR family mycofactocin-dependent oxidoreductase